jgi:hypothetical protein
MSDLLQLRQRYRDLAHPFHWNNGKRFPNTDPESLPGTQQKK